MRIQKQGKSRRALLRPKYYHRSTELILAGFDGPPARAFGALSISEKLLQSFGRFIRAFLQQPMARVFEHCDGHVRGD
jgi:hypothetical protein